MTAMNNIKRSNNIFTVIDVGNTKVSAIIGSSTKNNDVQVRVLGFGQHASFGIANGIVTDMKEIANSIAKTVEGAETMAGFPINKVTCSLSGGRSITKVTRIELKIDNDQVMKNDLAKIQKMNKPKEIDNYVLLSSSIIKYYVDNNTPVDNPIGIHTNNLIVEINNIYGQLGIIKNITSAINLCHLSIDKFIICSEASGLSTMIEDERKNGAIVIDLGGHITNIGVFLNDKIIFSDSIPIGGVHITSDIVRGLGTKSEDAEKIKILYGSAISNDMDEYTKINVPIISEDGEIRNQEIPKAMLTAIIKPRIEEIFELVKEKLSFLPLSTKPINKVILCGGGANLDNVRNFASSYLNTNVRIGRPIGLVNIPEIVHSPTFSCLTGLLIKSLKEEKLISKKINLGLFKSFGKIGNWFEQNL